jgi:hypothetical protein
MPTVFLLAHETMLTAAERLYGWHENRIKRCQEIRFFPIAVPCEAFVTRSVFKQRRVQRLEQTFMRKK